MIQVLLLLVNNKLLSVILFKIFFQQNERYFQRCNYLNQKEKTLLLEIHDLKLQAQSNNVNRRKKSQDAYSFEPHFLRRSHHQFQDSKKHNCKESHHDKPYYRRHRY